MENEFDYGDLVSFTYKGERYVGRIYLVHHDDKELTYDINVGGECPFIASRVTSETFVLVKKNGQ